MKKITVELLTFVIISVMMSVGVVMAQGHSDPAYVQVQSAEHELTIDGMLNETDWSRRFDHLIYRQNFIPGDVEYAVTAGAVVKETYTDTSTTIVRFLHYGMDLYISLQSDDKSVGKFGNSWEGDGLFMKIADANGVQVEYKLYYNLAGTDPDIAFEQPGLYPTAGAAAGYKMPGTVVNDTTQTDSGFTAEMVIHLDQLGYTSADTEIPVLINIFDPDGYLDNTDPWGAVGAYYKSWWGSEWGPDTRILRLADPPLKVAYKTADTITLDGQLNESFWVNAEQVVVAKGSASSSGGYYAQWGDTLNSYDDQSAATVKFMHNGTDLYVGVVSNDSSVGNWSPGWEADGLFLWMTFKGVIPGPGDRMEIKNMYFGSTQGTGTSFELSANVPTGGAEGASYEPAGTVTRTGTNGTDSGYSLETVVHTDLFGYSVGDTVMLGVVIWDLDQGAADEYSLHESDYAPNWWGTQWADANFEKYFMYRGVVLADVVNDVGDPGNNNAVNSFELQQNFPNPFNPTTTIGYTLPGTNNVHIQVYDLLGRQITNLVDAKQDAGYHSVSWNGRDGNGLQVGSGVYFYQIKAGKYTQIKKMVLMR